MKRITVCTGTTCYVMGAAELIEELEGAIERGELTAELRGSTCLGHCKARSNGAPPFLEVEGKPIAAASYETVVKEAGNG